jgi:hypothetical protein
VAILIARIQKKPLVSRLRSEQSPKEVTCGYFDYFIFKQRQISWLPSPLAQSALIVTLAHKSRRAVCSRGILGASCGGRRVAPAPPSKAAGDEDKDNDDGDDDDDPCTASAA